MQPFCEVLEPPHRTIAQRLILKLARWTLADGDPALRR
jgi:hypothetical protein